MNVNPLKASIVAAGAATLVGALFPLQAQAQFITDTPDPFLGSSLVLRTPVGTSLETPGFGYANTFTISNFSQTGSSFTGTAPNRTQNVGYDATFTATFYNNPALTGAPVSTQTLSGVFAASLANRNTAFQTGTFDFTVTNATFQNSATNPTLRTQLAASPATTGTVTITPLGTNPNTYEITSLATVFAEQFSGTPLVQGPAVPPLAGTSEPVPSDTTTPEPSSILGLLAVGAVSAISSFKRKSKEK